MNAVTRVSVGLSLVALLAALALGCVAPAMEVHASTNPEVRVELLFSHDGCDVYRFRDGAYHYFVRCDAPKTQVTAIEPVGCGKGCERDEMISTTTDTARK